MREDKARRNGKGKRGKGEGKMGTNIKGGDYAIKEKEKQLNRILNIKEFTIRKARLIIEYPGVLKA